MDTSTDVVYDSTVKYQIVAVYIISMIIWLVLVIALKMNEGLASIVIIIPFLVFMISFSSGWDLNHVSRKHMFQTPIVTICILIAVQFVMWTTQPKCGDSNKTLILITAAIVLALLSLIDIWSLPCHIVIWCHLRHAFQTMAVVVIIYATIYYCMARTCGSLNVS
jgi:hypothetical protein